MLIKKHRRIVLIDTRFQLRMAGSFILLQLVLTGLFAVALFLFMDSELKAGLASAHASYRSLDQMLLPIVAVLAGFSFLLSTVVVTSFVVLLSHRIAGPLYRFRLVLEGLAQRRIPADAKIRPDDQLGELSDTMGQALTTLRTDLGALRIAVAALDKARLDQDPQGTEASIADMKTLLAAWETPVRD